MMYQIMWTHRLDGHEGICDELYTSRAQAELIAEAEDLDVPELRHTVVPVQREARVPCPWGLAMVIGSLMWAVIVGAWMWWNS